jgi:NAD(P)-dependent dehydrogenase (short-subunit alcohol dehydrogenase family)
MKQRDWDEYHAQVTSWERGRYLQESGMSAETVEDDDLLGVQRPYEADARRSGEYLGAIPVGRFCAPEDVAVVAFLAGPSSTFVTGQSICVYGGTVLR